MNSSDEFSRLLVGDDGVVADPPGSAWLSASARDWFWITSALGTILLTLAWLWYGMAFFEEMSEQCKSLAAGSSEVGFGAIVGGIPLAIAYLVVALTLVLIGITFRARRTSGAVLTCAVLIGASLLAIGVNELLWGGNLFGMSAEAAACTIPVP